MLYAGPKMFYVMFCEFRTKLCQPKCYLDHLSDYYPTADIFCVQIFYYAEIHICKYHAAEILLEEGYFCHFRMPVEGEEVF
jgi:hypothetical protein